MPAKPPPLHLRPALIGDLDRLVSLENLSFSGDRLSRRSFRHLLQGKHSHCLVAESDAAELVGYVLLLFRQGSSLARIYSIAVHPDWRGRGVGQQLLTRAEQVAEQRGRRFVRLEVRADNEGAKAIYLGRGYRVFDRTEGYYDDGEAALRLEKSLEVAPRNSEGSPFYAQTTPFSCGPAALLMAMNKLKPENCGLDQRTELQLWREATTIFMTSGHGGCSPEGLALSAWQRGFAVTLYLQSDGIPFIDGVRDPQKKQIISRVHQDFVDRIAQTDIFCCDQAITPAQLRQHIDEGAAILTLISTWRLNRNKAPHWVFVTHADDQFVYLNDPDVEPDDHHPEHDNIDLPVARDAFEAMACFGRRKLKATLVIQPAKPGDRHTTDE